MHLTTRRRRWSSPLSASGAQAPGTRSSWAYLTLFVYDPATATSDFVLFDAWHVDQAPVAVVRLPQRVPQGLHGSWLAK